MDLREARELLGVAPTDDEKAVRRAYLRLLRSHPPERDPVGFARLREAFELARRLAPAARVSAEAPIAAGSDPVPSVFPLPAPAYDADASSVDEWGGELPPAPSLDLWLEALGRGAPTTAPARQADMPREEPGEVALARDAEGTGEAPHVACAAEQDPLQASAADPHALYRERLRAAADDAERERVGLEAIERLGTLEAYQMWLVVAQDQWPPERLAELLREGVARGHASLLSWLRLDHAAELHEHELGAWADVAAAENPFHFPVLVQELCARGKSAQAVEPSLTFCQRLATDPLVRRPDPRWAVDLTLALLEQGHTVDAVRVWHAFEEAYDGVQSEDPVHTTTAELIATAAVLNAQLARAIAAALRARAPERADRAVEQLTLTLSAREAREQASHLERHAPTLAGFYTRILRYGAHRKTRDSDWFAGVMVIVVCLAFVRLFSGACSGPSHHPQSIAAILDAADDRAAETFCARREVMCDTFRAWRRADKCADRERLAGQLESEVHGARRPGDLAAALQHVREQTDKCRAP